MGLILFQNYNSLPEACVAFSCLEAGGFHPNFQNYNHANLESLYIIAFGGIGIALPEQEFLQAKSYIEFCQTNAIVAPEDYDQIAERRFGKWKSGSFFALMFGVILPYFFLPAELLLLIWAAWLVWSDYQLMDFSSIYLLFPIILLHAKYIALPKLRRANAA